MDFDWRTALARLIDHTVLSPTATSAEVDKLIAEAAQLGTAAVCVSPTMLPIDAGNQHVAVVCGFPSGAHTTAVKVAEASEAVAQGADEVDMVIDLGQAKRGDFDAVRAQIAAVKAVVAAPRVLKVIIESAALSDNELIGCCQAAQQASADFVKTSTGFHPAGGASTHAVSVMRQTVGSQMGVKAAGGIRSASQALAMVEAGANRLGMSATVAALAEKVEPTAAQIAALEQFIRQ